LREWKAELTYSTFVLSGDRRWVGRFVAGGLASGRTSLNAKTAALQDSAICPDFPCRTVVNVSFVDDGDALAELQGRSQILLDQHDGLAGGGEIAACLRAAPCGKLDFR
jgi:hypothetical protein